MAVGRTNPAKMHQIDVSLVRGDPPLNRAQLDLQIAIEVGVEFVARRAALAKTR